MGIAKQIGKCQMGIKFWKWESDWELRSRLGIGKLEAKWELRNKMGIEKQNGN